MSPLIVPTFQPNWSMHSCFMVDFAKCAKSSRKRKKKKTQEKKKEGVSILRTGPEVSA